MEKKSQSSKPVPASKSTPLDNEATKNATTSKNTTTVSKRSSRFASGDCNTATSSSHTQFYKREISSNKYKRITTDEYLGVTESISGSNDIQCAHPSHGKVYTEKGLLKKNFKKILDPITPDSKWTKKCVVPVTTWKIIDSLEFLIKDPVGRENSERLKMHFNECAQISEKGFRIDKLDSVCVILDFMVESLEKSPNYRQELFLLLKNISRPILLTVNSDVITYLESLRNFQGFLGYLLIRFEDDDLFDLVSSGLLYQLTTTDKIRGHEAAQRRHSMEAAKKVLVETAVRMLAVASPHRFPTYVRIAFLLAEDCLENCIDLMMENAIEYIFYRFNPYFPERPLPVYDINPVELDDYRVQLGESTTNLHEILSLLLVLVQTIKPFVEQHPEYRDIFPYPDEYSQRCFIWAYRYECRAREHRHQRSTLTTFVNVLIYIYGDKLSELANNLMPDVLSLSVLTELPPRNDWTRTVNFNTSQADVQFKKVLVHLSVDFLRFYPQNRYMADSRNWIAGLMYLIDPGLCRLRCNWTTVLFAELRKTALQALVLSINLVSPHLSVQYSLIRRLMWYIEWYSESPYGFTVLYWCSRLLQVCLFQKKSPNRKYAVKELMQTHGIIILMHLCNTLLDQKSPPVQKSQNIIALILQVLVSSVWDDSRVTCAVYPHLQWPASITTLVKKILDTILYSLDKHFIICDRWLITFLNFVWQAVIWKDESRKKFIANNGIYQILDLIAATRYPAHCVALGIIADCLRSSDAVSQIVTWRANFGATFAYPNLVQQGATISSLLCALILNDCKYENIQLDNDNIIQDVDGLLQSEPYKAFLKSPADSRNFNQRTVACEAAAQLAGSRISKCYAILYLLSEDLDSKVALSDETYNLFKNVKLSPQQEALLVLCSHYLTLKINDAWLETAYESPGFVAEDNETLNEFLQVGRGWARYVRQQQLQVLERRNVNEHDQECTLYSFLSRVRLNVALDALRELRCIARSADRDRIQHAMLYEAVHGFHRRSIAVKKMEAPVIRTYEPTLDEGNVIGQNLKVISISTKEKPKSREAYSDSPKET